MPIKISKLLSVLSSFRTCYENFSKIDFVLKNGILKIHGHHNFIDLRAHIGIEPYQGPNVSWTCEPDKVDALYEEIYSIYKSEGDAIANISFVEQLIAKYGVVFYEND